MLISIKGLERQGYRVDVTEETISITAAHGNQAAINHLRDLLDDVVTTPEFKDALLGLTLSTIESFQILEAIRR